MEPSRPPKPSERDPIGICGHTGILAHSYYLTEPKTVGDLYESGALVPEDLLATPHRPVEWLAVCDACARESLEKITIRVVRRLGYLRDEARGYLN